MKPVPVTHPHRRLPWRPGNYRPWLETLEARLPPGDALLSALLAGAGTGASLTGPDPAAAASSVARIGTDPNNDNEIDAITSGTIARHYTKSGNVYNPSFFVKDTLTQESNNAARFSFS